MVFLLTVSSSLDQRVAGLHLANQLSRGELDQSAVRGEGVEYNCQFGFYLSIILTWDLWSEPDQGRT